MISTHYTRRIKFPHVCLKQQVGILWSAPMDNGGSEVLSYKVRFEDQAGNLTSITVDAGDMWDLQELQVACAATVCM